MAKAGRKPKVVPEDVLEVFGAREDRAEPLIASEIADTLGCSRKTAYNKLRALEEDGDLTSKKVGGRSRVYWIPISSPIEGGESVAATDQPIDVGFSENLDTDQDTDAVWRAIQAVDTPGSGDTAAIRERALREVYDYLRMEGEGSKSAFGEYLSANNIDVGYRGGFDSFWTNYVKAKDALKQLPNVEAPGEGEHMWRYTGDDQP